MDFSYFMLTMICIGLIACIILVCVPIDAPLIPVAADAAADVIGWFDANLVGWLA